jgi:hypothetical protein
MTLVTPLLELCRAEQYPLSVNPFVVVAEGVAP